MKEELKVLKYVGMIIVFFLVGGFVAAMAAETKTFQGMGAPTWAFLAGMMVVAVRSMMIAASR